MDPLKTLGEWIAEARALGVHEPDAMALATDGPHVRIVLCRGIGPREIRFFTNYESVKGQDIARSPKVAAAFWWGVLARQVRVEGTAEKLDAAASDAYFASRPEGSQLSAIVSPQSKEIASLDELHAARARLRPPLARPENWGGYRIVVDAVELWWSRPDRLHERRRFEHTGSGWSEKLLAP
jgi:pyridoxamine 5'-phosphate oxidase